MLDEGVHATLEDLARNKRVAPSILDGRQPEELQLDDLFEAFPLEWEIQACRWAIRPANFDGMHSCRTNPRR
jgi:hypothetical protein